MGNQPRDKVSIESISFRKESLVVPPILPVEIKWQLVSVFLFAATFYLIKMDDKVQSS